MMRWLLLLFLLSVPARAADPAAEFFEKKVRPLLAENCFACHGPEKQKAGLRVDSRSALAKGGDSGPALDANHTDKSLLLEVVGYTAETKMPPKAKMPDEQIAILKEWVKQGAIWPNDTGTAAKVEAFDLKKRAGHWSLQPIKAVGPPAGAGSPIDRFLAAKLKEKGLNASPRASKEALLRRLSFDLTGLPPSIAELDAFLADASPDAYVRQVNRLLGSPRYGELWARHWLDVVRYAETMGHEFDIDMFEPWRYRDYVVRAFNRDVPYNQFLKEHIAGDLLGDGTRYVDHFNESILGTNFWFFHEAVHAPVDVRKDQADRFDNQIDVFGKAFLGTTISCARCHDHKFDAVTTKDYYALFGMLESSRFAKVFRESDASRLPCNEVTLRMVRLAAQAKLKEAFAELIFQRKRDSDEARVDVPDESKMKQRIPNLFDVDGDLRNRLLCIVDGQWRFNGDASLASVTSHTMEATAPRSCSFKIEGDYLHLFVAGRKASLRVVVDHYQLIRDPIYGGLQFTINSGPDAAWRTIKTAMWKGHQAYIEILDDGDGEGVLYDARFSDSATPVLVSKTISISATLAKWRRHESLGPAELQLVNRLLKETQPLVVNDLSKDFKEQLAFAKVGFEEIGSPSRAIGMIEGTPQDSPVFIRGNPAKTGEIVPRRFLEVLGSKPFTKGSGRLELAQQMVDESNPLVRRVIVNRVWQHLMGEGIVASVDDFGVQGSPPTHPELLDWLATDFAKNGWSIQKMIRKIVMSDAYQQVSRTRPDAATADPRNQLIHRSNLKRLQAEQIRDSMLYISGKLNEKREGPGVPPYLTPNMQGRGRPAKSGPMDGDGRRSIYLQVRRNFPNPMLTAFDLPTPFTTMGRRNVSNVPGQALTMLNNPLVHQLSEAWAKNVMDLKKNDSDRITTLYRMAFARKPSEAEMETSREFLVELKDEPEAARWASLAHSLINAKEFIFVP